MVEETAKAKADALAQIYSRLNDLARRIMQAKLELPLVSREEEGDNHLQLKAAQAKVATLVAELDEGYSVQRGKTPQGHLLESMVKLVHSNMAEYWNEMEEGEEPPLAQARADLAHDDTMFSA